MTRGLGRGLTDYGDRDFSLYFRRAFAKSMGYSDEMLERPIVGIATSGGGFNNCHRTMPELVAAVSRGVIASGGLPLEFPTISLGEPFLAPTSMMFRNLMSMDVEEMIRAQPMDAVVTIGGCDKTLPAQLMGALSAGKPAIALAVGPMLTGRFEGTRVGACTDCRAYWARYRAGELSREAIGEVESNLGVTAGTCAVMGTASTMACVTEALGMSLPGSATPPAVHAQRLRVAEATGCRAVALASEGLTPERIVTPASLENALRVLLALGGSTNAVIHLTAIAGRLGIPLSLERFNALSADTPVLVNLKPVGNAYMEDFHAAGGLGAVLRELAPKLHLETRSVAGETLAERLAREPAYVDRLVVAASDAPLVERDALVALFGNLAPKGALLKAAAADARLLEHEGRAVVFTGLEDLAQRIDRPDLAVEPGDVLVLQNAGPLGAGMPEAGYLPIPKKLAERGVRDMLRVSDARMSGTAYGAVVLHVSPESAAGGPLGAVRDGDRIRISLRQKRIDVLLSEEDLSRRLRAFVPPALPARGYARIYAQQMLGAEDGCDFECLRAS
ncbi:MAG TPA: dihydroxy-acid dehydratase [Candidatus Baltobacteraceae bacterium]|nr:dihydroxy-acid dehydratase [Candidatus Baltobacteraceae bacterium]